MVLSASFTNSGCQNLQELIATWRDLGLLIQSLMVTRQKVIEQKVLGFGPHVGSNYITGRSQS